MRIRLINIDSIIPNLALMQLSTYHKSIGDEVGFDVNNPDRVYVSCLFQKNAGLARGMPSMFPDSEVILGGSGFYNTDDLHNELFTRTIPLDAQKVIPDYSLYPTMIMISDLQPVGVLGIVHFVLSKPKRAISKDGNTSASSTIQNTKKYTYWTIISMVLKIGFLKILIMLSIKVLSLKFIQDLISESSLMK